MLIKMSFRDHLHFAFLKPPKYQINSSKLIPVATGICVFIGIMGVLLPINGYVIVNIGLIVDIVGALFIISPLVNQFKMHNRILFFKRSLLSSKTIDKMEENKIKQDEHKGRLGLTLLLEGFILQIIGNVFQYFDSLS